MDRTDDSTLVRLANQAKSSRRVAAIDQRQVLERLRHLSYLLDSAFRIPVIGYRVGWDAVLGLVPVLGDAVGMLFSGYIVVEAARLGVPKRVLARMIFNLALDAIIGSIPLIGSLFDAVWKANIRNMRLLERTLNG